MNSTSLALLPEVFFEFSVVCLEMIFLDYDWKGKKQILLANI